MMGHLLRHAVLVLTLLACVPVGFAVEVFAAKTPNVVVFLADDAGWGDYSFSGNQTHTTPNIDSIATSGVSMDRFFVCPVCAPTRAEFLTGRYHPRGGVWGVSTGQERLDPEERTVADAFRAAGYATGAFGKWHNGSQWPYHPMGRGFDEYFGHTAGHWGEYFDAPLEQNGKMIRTEGFITDVCTDQALRFIEENRKQPFFCYIPFSTPHSPWAVPDEYWQQYLDREVKQQGSQPKNETTEQTRCALAMVRQQDSCVGRVLKALEAHGLRENTIIVYFSDNGPNSWRWNDGMKGRKGSTDEGGIRSVCYISWPQGIPPGRTLPQISGAIDLLPTLTSLAGINRAGDRPLDGRDLSPLLKNSAADWSDRTIISSWAGRVSARTQRFRLDNDGKLYDMQQDPGQSVAVNTQHPAIAESLQREVAEWRENVLSITRKANEGVGRRGVDPRPLTVGYREFPITMLPARDGTPSDGVERSSSAPNCSYFVNWKTTAGRMTWHIDVHTAGEYEATVDYTCAEGDAGSVVELSAAGNASLKANVTTAWDPPLYTNQDTLVRPAGESQMKPFRSLRLGTILLQDGEQDLVLRALEIPGRSVMDVRRITLTLKTD